MTSEQFVNIVPVPERLLFDEVGLERYVRRNLEDFWGRILVKQFSRGLSNPTYLITAGDKQYVLRRKPPGKLLPSAHLIEREYQVMTALRDSGVPVPRTYALCEDPSVIGTAFYIMEYLRGRAFADPTLPGITVPERQAILDDAIRVIAALHQVDYVSAGLTEYGRPGSYIGRQISRWVRQYRASETERIEPLERLMEWLPSRIPEEDESTIVHGDFKMGNLIIHPTEQRVIAVLDWELSTIGHPLADFAYFAMAWRIPTPPEGMGNADLKSLGIPGEEACVAEYCRRTGRDSILNWDFYVVFNLFRLAAIYQGVFKRAQEGNASSQDALEAGLRARSFAELGWREAQRALGAR
jgi:aminoglycoside phosphotransferase (APT) family kinase protein